MKSLRLLCNLQTSFCCIVFLLFCLVRVGMAWRSHGSSNDELVENLKKHGVITKARVAGVMKKVDRAHFSKRSPYRDTPQSIGYSVTISAPHMHAHALELLADHLLEGSMVLDVGSGSGYLTACMALMVGQTGKVIGIDHIEELVRASVANVRKGDFTSRLLDRGQLEFVVGDGREGYSQGGPYDAIHVGAASSGVPDALVSQLKPGGRLIVPVEHWAGSQMLMQVDKALDSTVTHRELMGVMFVPLTSKESQWPSGKSKEDL
ncbi:protein-L-isoaspartate(D-aspartate) O-methyltransferase-like [Babylonia areolata]|uniref:protein-L-isoaspartate(D-aspartate) O-methyltransferase-like n=1 Tax=Babylonia areolata TaxID=304850 RepID=UPI003FD430C1